MSVQSVNPQVTNYPKTPLRKKHYPWQSFASFCIPGVGQFIKGDNKKGKKDLGIHLGIYGAALISGIAVGVSVGMKNFKKSIDSSLKAPLDAKNTKGAQGVSALLFLAFAAILTVASIMNRVHSACDAYKATPVKESLKS